MGDKIIPVRVAVRIRPLSDREERQGCQNALGTVAKNNQIYLLDQAAKSFSFDYAFAPSDSQDKLYNTSVKDLIKQLFEGNFKTK